MPANPADTIRCAKLAENAVHGAMAGYTAFSTGIVRNAVCWIPIKTINQAGVNKISVYDRVFQRLLASIKQKIMIDETTTQAAFEKIQETEEKKAEAYRAIEERVKKEDIQRELNN